MVRIRSKPVKARNSNPVAPRNPARKRNLDDAAAGHPSAPNGNTSLRASKRVRSSHVPYQSPESVDVIITAVTRGKKGVVETPKTKPQSLSQRPRKLKMPEKPLKRLQKKQVSLKSQQAIKGKASVRRKLLATPEPVKAKGSKKAVALRNELKKKATKQAAVAIVKKIGIKAKAASKKSSPAGADEIQTATVAVVPKKRKKAATKDDAVKDAPKQKESKKKEPKRKQGRLNPKPDLTAYEKNPNFESRLDIPFISTLAQSRLIIRAVLLNDMKMLKQLVHSEPGKIYTTELGKNHNDTDDAFTYIYKSENKEAFKLLHKIPDKIIEKFGSSPGLLLTDEDTGHGSTMMFGHALRNVSVGRGGKEGNNAFLYDKDLYNYGRTGYINSIAKALELGVSQSFIKFLTEQLELHCWDFTDLKTPLRKGHNQLVGVGIADALKRGGYGFNQLHQEAASSKKSAELTPFKPVSVVKKCTYGPRFTPLHCAATNPNVDVLSALLRSMPDYNLADGDGWTVGHYAAVCSGPEPLKYLLQFGISTHAITSAKRGGDGYSLLHAAVSAGRTHNVKIILDHEKAAKDSPSIADAEEEDPKLKQKNLLQNDILYKSTTKGMNPLHMACALGYSEIVKLLLKAGIDANRPTPAKYEKLTSLMIACQFGHLDIVKILVEAGLKVEAKDKRGRTAAAHAAMNGQTHILSYLLRLGVNHLAVDSSGNSLLHYATAYGWYFETLLLLEAGCPPNAVNSWKLTPVAAAFMKGHTGLVEILMKQEGVDVGASIDDDSGRTLLLETCFRNSDLPKLKFLIETLQADPKGEDFNKNGPLHYFASKLMHEDSYDFKEKIKPFNECVEYLIQKGCDPFKKNETGRSTILMAGEVDNFHYILKLLQLKQKIPCEKFEEDGNTLLHHIVTRFLSNNAAYTVFNKWTADASSLPVLKEMAKFYNKDGFTPFLSLLETHRQGISEENVAKILKVAEIFLAKLAVPINDVVKNKSKNTALHLAMGVNYANDIIPILLKYKPELEALNEHAQTPLVAAVLGGSGLSSVAEKLIDAGANVNFKIAKEHGIGLVLFAAMKETSTFHLIYKLLQKGAYPHEVHPKSKNSLLHYIARKPTLSTAADAITVVLEKGVNANLKNCDGRTALHLAVNARGSETDVFYDIEDALISSGANLAIKDLRGRIPLHYAFVKIGKPMEKSFFDPIELVSSLVAAMKASRAAADIHSTDVFGSTPLHYSAFRGATICSSYLIQAISRNGVDLCDNNGNTPFALAVRNCHEGCSLNFYQRDADFLRTINNNIKPEEIRTEEAAPQVKHAAQNEPWQWNHLVEENAATVKLQEEQEKFPILEQVVKHNWQGLLYLMIGRLESSGVGLSTGIATALKTNRLKLALKLCLRVKSAKELKLDSGTMFHNLAKMYTGSQNDIVTKIRESFLKHGQDPTSVDEFGSQPIIYGIVNLQTNLADILFNTTKDPMKNMATMKPDLFGRTPFTALFWKLDSEASFGTEIETWANQLVAAGCNPNHLCEYPIVLSSFPGVRFTRKLTDIIPSNGPRYPPLIVAVVAKCYRTVKWLLNLRSGSHPVNINCPDSEGRTALMHAVRLNDIRMVKVLLDPQVYDYTKDVHGTKNITIRSSNIDPTVQDKKGWTVMDHLMQSTGSYWQYKNVQGILQLLHQLSGTSTIISGDGLRPIDRAVQLKRPDIADSLTKHLAPKHKPLVQHEYADFAPVYSQDIVVTPIQDFASAAEKMGEKIIEKTREKIRREGGEDVLKPKPDELCGLDKNNAELMIDEKQSIPYDVLMTKVDLSYGIHGLYNFYKMQLVKQPRGKEMIILFTQWGRVGDQGQYQKTPFPTEEEAVKEFTKIFKAKSGNAWKDVQNFTPIPSKYRVVKRDLRLVKYSTQVDVDFEELEKSGRTKSSPVPGSTLFLLKSLCLVHRDVSSIYGHKRHYYNRYASSPDYCKLPLLPMETLQKGESILKEISELIESEEQMKNDKKGKFTELDRVAVMTKITHLSEEFYALIPIYGYATERLEPMFQRDDLRTKVEAISHLVHLELAKTLLLSAQFNLESTNPFEYVYRCLGTKLQLLDRKNSTEKDEAELVLQYIHNTSDKANVHGIYRVQRASESQRLNMLGIHNRQLLWHGTSSVNLLSILQQGLQVAPLGAEISGHLFGKGIYLADMFEKSQKYCRTVTVNGKTRKFMLLCEAALGKIYEVKLHEASDKPMPSGYDSLKTADSRYQPDPESTVIWKGRTVALGKRTEKVFKEDDYWGLDYNEYIVFNTNQVAMRYLIEFED